MKAKKIYPDWVEKQHTAGTTIRQVKDNYYLYSCTSKYVKGKKYPVTIQRYIGKITEEGLIKPDTISFIPTKDIMVLLRDVFDISDIKEDDRELISYIPLLKQSSLYYVGKLSAKTSKVLEKYFEIDGGILLEKSK